MLRDPLAKPTMKRPTNSSDISFAHHIHKREQNASTFPNTIDLLRPRYSVYTPPVKEPRNAPKTDMLARITKNV